METALAVLSGVAAATAVASRKVGVAGRNVRLQVPGNEVPGVAELVPRGENQAVFDLRLNSPHYP